MYTDNEPILPTIAIPQGRSASSKLVAPSPCEVLRCPLQPMDNLRLVEEGLLHPEKPEVFLTASMHFLRRKLELRMQQLQSSGVNITCPCQMASLSRQCYCCSGSPCVGDAENCFLSCSNIKSEDSEKCLFPSNACVKGPLEIQSDTIIYWNQGNVSGEHRPAAQDLKCTESAPAYGYFYETTLPSKPKGIEDKKEMRDAKCKTRVNIRISKNGKHYSKVQSAVLQLLGSKSKCHSKEIMMIPSQDSMDTEASGVQLVNKEEMNTFTDDGNKMLMRKDVTSCHINQEMSPQNTMKKLGSNMSTKASRSKISSAFLNLFSRDDKDVRHKDNTDSPSQAGDNREGSVYKREEDISSNPVEDLSQFTSVSGIFTLTAACDSNSIGISKSVRFQLDPIDIRRNRFHSTVQIEPPDLNSKVSESLVANKTTYIRQSVSRIIQKTDDSFSWGENDSLTSIYVSQFEENPVNRINGAPQEYHQGTHSCVRKQLSKLSVCETDCSCSELELDKSSEAPHVLQDIFIARNTRCSSCSRSKKS